MKKTLKNIIIALLSVGVIFGFYASYKYVKGPEVVVPSDEGGVVSDMTELDHDIWVSEPLKCIFYGDKTGFDVTVGPTGWPVGSDLRWEIALYEGSDDYYARLILHEYMLWWSWDDPYLLIKIPKRYVDGDPVGNEKYRWDMLWDFTYATARSYNYEPYVRDAVIQKINGHTVSFGPWVFSYYKYLVISDNCSPW